MTQQPSRAGSEHHLCLRGPAVNSIRSMRRIHNNIKYCVIERRPRPPVAEQLPVPRKGSRSWGRNRRDARQNPAPCPASLHITGLQSTASSLSLHTLYLNVTSDLARWCGPIMFLPYIAILPPLYSPVFLFLSCSLAWLAGSQSSENQDSFL